MVSIRNLWKASRTYQICLAGCTFLSRQHPLVHIRNHCLGIRNRHVCIDYQLGLKDAGEFTDSWRNLPNVH